MKHKTDFRIYYEDTDAGGVVYYANYLKFAERARTEMLREAGIHQAELAEREDCFFVVRRAELDLRSPARLDDIVTVMSETTALKGASIRMRQLLYREETLLAQISVTIACVTSEMQPRRIPETVRPSLLAAQDAE